MAMTTCGECGKDVSTTAKACPNCGVQRSSTNYGFLTYAVVGISVVIGIAMFGSGNNSSPSRSFSSVAASDARKVCDALENTDIELICKVLPGDRKITLVIYTSAGEAAKMCSGIREQIKPYTKQLDMWQLTLYSPVDITTPSASCFL